MMFLKTVCHSIASIFMVGEVLSSDWQEIMFRYNLPITHGSGIYVDLGGTVSYPTSSTDKTERDYRVAVGKCPVLGKRIILGTGADFLAPAQDGDPPKGGFNFPALEDSIVKISPVPIEELSKNPEDKPFSVCLNHVGTTFLLHPNEGSSDPTAKFSHDYYHYVGYFQEDKKMCNVLYYQMQKNEGETYCDNKKGGALMYCFHPVKTKKDSKNYYFTYNTNPMWEDECPLYPLKGFNFGQWTGTECIRMLPVSTKPGLNFTQCSISTFLNSSSDQPKDYDSRQLHDIIKDIFVNLDFSDLVSVFDKGSKKVYSGSDGVNYLNWSPSHGCQMYNTIPDCLIPVEGGIASTALSSADEADLKSPKCSGPIEGLVTKGKCQCFRSIRPVQSCKGGEWTDSSESCSCTILWAGLATLGVILVAAIMVLVMWKQKSKLSPEEISQTEFVVIPKKQKFRDEELQEADASFWGDSNVNVTGVLVDDKESYTADEEREPADDAVTPKRINEQY